MAMEVIALRPLTIDGKTYKAGDSVMGLSPEKAGQLVAQRQLRLKHEATQKYVALRTFTVKGRVVNRGDMFQVRKMSPDKLHQLLEQRYLEPAPSTN
jgi:hypothetical protein